MPAAASSQSPRWPEGPGQQPSRASMERFDGWAMAQLSATARNTETASTFRRGLDRASNVLAVAAAAVAASLSELNNVAVDPQVISRLAAAAAHHGVAAADLLAQLPGELEHVGQKAIEAFLNGGDALGKHWTAIQTPLPAPERAARAAGGI
jgi:hypothetical protein